MDGAVAGGGEGVLNEGAEVVVGEDLEGGGGGAAFGGDGVAEGFGVLLGLNEEGGGAVEGVEGEGMGEEGVEAELGAGVAEGGGEFEDVGGTGAGKGGDGIELGFLNFVVIAEGVEDGFDACFVVGVECLGGGVGGDAGADLPGGVGHGADDVAGVGEAVVKGLEGGAGEDGEDEFVLGGVGEGGVDLGELLGFAGEDEGMGGLEGGGEVGEVGDAGGLGEFGAGGVVAAGAGDLVGGVVLVLDESVDDGGGHASGSEECDLGGHGFSFGLGARFSNVFRR